MANGEVHKFVGTLAGTGFAYYAARNQPDISRVIEALGGAVGGFVGGKLPDVFDPPLHPRHRSVAHAIVPLGVAAHQCARYLQTWQETLRRFAQNEAALKTQSQDPLERIWHSMLEFAYRLISGAIAGLIAGYASHVALDAVTPSGLPVFC